MEIIEHNLKELKVAEVISNEIIIQNTEDALDLIGNLYYQGFERIFIHKKNITSDFFDLKTGIAGDVLQKFSQYRMSLAIIGDFSEFNSRILKDLIYESNKGRQIKFLNTIEEAIKFQ